MPSNDYLGQDCDGILTSSSVSRLGQNSKSSSKSNERPASKRIRNAELVGLSVNSFMLLTPRNCRCEFWELDRRGALLERPPWWLCDDECDDADEG